MKLSKKLQDATLFVTAATAAWLAPAGAAQAQTPSQQAQGASTSETVIVTGSYIRGTPENAALPVSVLTQDELINRGAPTMLDLIKALPESNGVLGDTNQFDSRSQGAEGSGTVNLRGLGPQRTLVLLNGHRLVTNPFAIAAAGAVDTNALPAAAIGRIEVLKEGAAATYGSDAIGGVVNFITRDDFNGFEVAGDYSAIDGSDGDYDASGLWGVHTNNARLVLSLAGQHRSEISMQDRDWATLPYLTNPQGGWSAAGSPNTYISLVNGHRFVDPGCSNLQPTPPGATLTGAPPSVSPVCYWQYTKFDNLVEDEDRFQAFGNFELDLTDTTTFHVDALFSRTMSGYNTSPSYALLQTPTAFDGAVSAQFFVPATNPGLVDFVTNGAAEGFGSFPGVIASTGAPTAETPASAGGPGVLYIAGRPYALGGNPLFNHGAVESVRKFSVFSASAGLNGEFPSGVRWEASVTYGRDEAYRDGRDTIVNRFQRALRGLGGPACPTLGGTPGAGGCLWFNPFSTSIPANAITGHTNPNYKPALASNENPDLINWFFPNMYTRDTNTLLVTDLVFSGESSWTLQGGAIAWALGIQRREETYERELSDFNNIDLNPCIDSIDFGINNCAIHTGALGFLGSSSESHLSRDINAVFGELSIPFTNSVEMQIAGRYENYGGATGSTFDPKVSVRWQLLDVLALRASAGSTFRAPALTQTTNGNITALQSVLGTFRAVDIFGNPNLQPETAKTYSVGAIFDNRTVFATIDYWRFDFDDAITNEPLGGMVATLFPNGNSAPNNCGVGAFAGLEARFTFNGGVCGPANIIRVHTDYVNGAPIRNAGVDATARVNFDGGFAGGAFELGGTVTYVLDYSVGATSVGGVTVLPAFNAVGKLNYQTQVYPIPRWRGHAYIEWSTENQNLRLTANMTDHYKDQRTEPFIASLATNNTVISAGKEIDSLLTFDLNYRLDLGTSSIFTIGVQNLTDEDPPFARLDLNYDPLTANGVGRVLRVGLRHSF